MRIVSPAPNARFEITADGTAPNIEFLTDAQGPHRWTWSASWRSRLERGAIDTPGNAWRAQRELADIGGELTVRATAGQGSASITIRIVGTNPTQQQWHAFVTAQPGHDGMHAIIQHESRGRQFDQNGQPLGSFDGGFGLCQLTNPVPTYRQCWSWKQNVRAGLALMAEKRRFAINHLARSGRTYTQDQLRRETTARWNGGAYHVWDGQAWVRNPDILCDPNTGNIGWNLTDPDNAGLTLQQLRARDGGAFRRPRRNDADWQYSGVCYADAVLG